MNGDVNEVDGGSRRATKRRMSSVSNEDSGEGTKRPATGFTMSIDERNELRMKERKAQSAVTEKVTTIVEREFAVSVTDKEKEIFEIDRRLLQLRKALHLVRYGAVTNYYALTVDKQTRANPESVSIHPAVRKLIGGKRPTRRSVAEAASVTPPSTSRAMSSVGADDKVKTEPNVMPTEPAVVPGYFPPLDKNPDWTADPRGIHHKVKRRLVVGNVSKWIACDQREDLATHKWMIYVRGDRDHPDVSDVVAKVRFLIHPSYHPHDLVEVTNAPFHLTRRGWGEFPARVQIHFRHPEDNKPIDLIHNLKLDKTYTGLQTLGAETNVDVWLHNPEMVRSNVSLPDKKGDVEGEDIADPSLNYRLMHTEAEGWVISHTDANNLRPELDGPVASAATVDIDSLLSDELPDMLKGEKSKMRSVGGTGIAGSYKKVLSAATKENNSFNVKRYEMNGGHLSVKKVDGENAAADAVVDDSPLNGSEMGGVNGDGTYSAGDTTYIRCTDKTGKPFYLPVKILPSNHQRASSPYQPQLHQQHQDWFPLE